MTTNAIHFDIATLLNDNALGSLGVDLFGGEWGSVDAQTLVLDGAGTVSPLKQTYEQPSVQILVRGEKLQASHLVYATAKAIYDFLVTQSESVTINTTEYKGFEPSSNIAPLGKDANERHIYSMNFSTYRAAI